MIVCSCNVISDREFRRAAEELRANGMAIVTPGAAFRALGRRPRCGGCLPTVVSLVLGEERAVAAAAADSKETDRP